MRAAELIKVQWNLAIVAIKPHLPCKEFAVPKFWSILKTVTTTNRTQAMKTAPSQKLSPDLTMITMETYNV